MEIRLEGDDVLIFKGKSVHIGKFSLVHDAIIYLLKKVEELPSSQHAKDIEKDMLERQLAKVEVLSCKGDPDGKALPTEILLKMGNETKLFIPSPSLSDLYLNLINEQDEYIKLLGEEIEELAGIASIHGWNSSRGYMGKAFRERIKEIKTEIGIQNEN